MSKRIQEFYNSDPSKEWNRLSHPFQCVELLSTLHLVEKYFPAKGHIADIGCGPGKYALELFIRGYQVSMLDYSKSLLDFAESKLNEYGYKPQKIVHGNAMDMAAFSSNSFEGALFLGPLYHLLKREERLRSLHELKRILKDGGVAVAAYINSWGVLKSGINDFPAKFANPNNLKMLLGDTIYDNADGGGFTESYWSTPPIALDEVRSAGFEVISYAGAEGFVSGMERLMENLSHTDPTAHSSVVKFAAEHAELPQYRDATEHIHIVIKKPDVGL